MDWTWRELKDAGEELPDVVKSEDGDSGLQSQELGADQGFRFPMGKVDGEHHESQQWRQYGSYVVEQQYGSGSSETEDHV